MRLPYGENFISLASAVFETLAA